MRRSLSVLSFVAALGLLAGCSDDGGSVRTEGGTGSTGSGGSGSGLSASDLGSQSSDKDITAAVAAYKAYVVGQAGQARKDAKPFTDAVRAGNVAEAQRQYAPSRVSWERIEPVAALVEQIDGAIDARVDDFADENDPKWTGWHKIEYLLWVKKTAAGGAPLADKLDKDLATLEAQLKTIEFTPRAVTLGAGALIEEVSKGKITGEEDRYSRTDFSDFAANVEGSKAAYWVFKPLLQAKDAALVKTLDGGFTAVEGTLKPYEVASGGYQPYTALKPADKASMQAKLATLSEDLAKLPAALGVA